MGFLRLVGRLGLWGLLLGLCWGGVVGAGVSSAVAQTITSGDPIEQVVIEGNQRIEADTIRSYMEINPGDLFDAAKVDPTAIGATVRTLVPRWQAALARDDVRDRPQPATWSTLEYGAHVRDVFRVMDQRLALLLDQDDPQFANWDQDATAVAERYGEQDPALVAQQLGAAAVVLADRYDSVPSDAWQRPGRRSNGSVFTVDTLGRYMLHDVLHHLHDVHA